MEHCDVHISRLEGWSRPWQIHPRIHRPFAGAIRIRVTQRFVSGEAQSFGGAIISKDRFGFGTYEFEMRMSSTSATPNGEGKASTGAISSGFLYHNKSESEIDLEFLGNENAIWISSWHNPDPRGNPSPFDKTARRSVTKTSQPGSVNTRLFGPRKRWTSTSTTLTSHTRRSMCRKHRPISSSSTTALTATNGVASRRLELIDISSFAASRSHPWEITERHAEFHHVRHRVPSHPERGEIFLGNNIKANDYLNVVVQTLAHVAPIRNFFLLHAFESTSPQLPIRFSTLVRKIWNPKAFRNHVSPHELLQEITLRSSKRFTLTNQSDPVEFLSWFLNNLHLTLGGSKTKPFSSIIQKTFQGKLRMESQAITARSDTAGERLRFEESSTITSNITPYLILTLDLPPTPLFRDAIEAKNIIPQVPLTTLLQKYSGLHASEKQAPPHPPPTSPSIASVFALPHQKIQCE